MAHEIKVGDVVQFLGEPYFDLQKDEIGIVIRVDNDAICPVAFKPIRFSTDYGDTGYWFSPDDCKKLTTIDKE